MSVALQRMLWEQELGRNRVAYEAQLARIAEVTHAFYEGMLFGIGGPDNSEQKPSDAWARSKTHHRLFSGLVRPFPLVRLRCPKGHAVDWAGSIKLPFVPLVGDDGSLPQ